MTEHVPGPSQTPLQRVLAVPTPAKPTPLLVFELARRRFFAGERIDMGDLAFEAGVSRATLNRWVGSREALIGEVLYAIAENAFGRAERETTGSGRQRISAVLERFFAGVITPGPYRAFVANNAQLALSLCTSKEGPVQRRLIERTASLLEHEGAATGSAMTRHEMAYALIRIGEAFVYYDLITGDEPNLTPAVAIWDRILA